ncbi:MAG TPA: aldehyde dehydrogenase family protein [Terriglobales bacterium]|nr:aldehyde dehydrogenase family protein [Terriglobales bacterium]
MSTSTIDVSAKLLNRNPATGEVISEHTVATATEVSAAVARARAAQPAWNALGTNRRIGMVRKFQKLLLRDRESVAQKITAEAGKPLVESFLSEVIVALDAARFCAENAHRALRIEAVHHGNPILRKRARLVYEPVGVIGIISPWNYPFSTPATETLAALVTGNTVVLKPSELTPISALELQRLLHEAGVPEDAFAVVLGEGPAGAALVEAPIDKLIFTGSVATGKRVAEAAARRLLPVVLELGGKDPMLVLDDADVEIASSAAVWGSMMNAGQTCLSVERCYVHRKIFDSFVAACAEKILRLKVGDGADSNTDVGPLVSEKQLQVVESQVEDARAQGAKILTGGKRLPELGRNFYAPTLVTGVTDAMRLMQDETFGPVLPLIPFSSDAEAVRLANASQFGLSASVFSRNTVRAEALARQLHAGAVMVNDVVVSFAVPEAPHGGTRVSGIGRTHGLLGMREMLNPKYIATDTIPGMKKVWWYPYGEPFTRQMSAFADLLFTSTSVRRLNAALKSSGSLWRKKL